MDIYDVKHPSASDVSIPQMNNIARLLKVACLQIELVLTAATFSVAIIGSIAGIFGMNLNNRREDSYTIFLVVSKLVTPCKASCN